MVVKVLGNDVQKALKVLKRKLQQSGRDWEIAKKKSYTKPSAQRRADHRRSMRRIRKEAAHGA